MPTPNANTKTNIDGQRKRANNTSRMKSSKAATAKYSKAKQPIKKVRRLLWKSSNPSSNKKKQNRQQAQKKTKAHLLLTQYATRWVAKGFLANIYFGTVSPKDSYLLSVVTVTYDDGDYEQPDAKDLEEALKLYEKERSMIEKLRGEAARVSSQKKQRKKH
jgi:hypothetical protein